MTDLRHRVERLEHAATSSTQSGATANDLANFPGMMNLVAGSGVSLTPGTGTLTITATGGGGTVTSVGMSVPSFLSVSGSPVTTSGALAVTYSGTALPIANGGSGQTTANAALNAFLPSQATHSGKVLQTDGTNTSWQTNGSGTVTSVGVSTGSSGVSVTGSPVTTSGTIDLDLGTLANVDDAPSDGTTYGRLNGAWAAAGGGGGQAAIQFQDEGSNLGAAGTVDTLDFTGAGVTATRVGDVVTVNVNALSRTESASLVGGTGEDGAVDFDGTNTFSFASKSGSVYTLNRNIAPSVLRITTGVTVLPAGFCVWAQTWDCTSGFYGQFIGSGNPGNSTTTQNAGSQGLPRWSASSYFFPGSPGVNGTAATTTNSSNGSASGNAANAWGDKGSQGGRGGDSGANTAGTVGSAGSASGYVPFAGVLDRQFASLTSFTVYVAGTGATGGTGGAGDGTNKGGGGGGGGATGAGLHLFVGVLTTDATTPARIIDFRGGDGGNGATRVTGNVGGGGGGAGGHGGGVRMILGYHIGPAAVDFIDVSGGNGGNGGSGVGTGLDGTGGTSGASGRAQLYLYSSVAWSFTTLTAGTAAVGTAGQPGADGTLDIP